VSLERGSAYLTKTLEYLPVFKGLKTDPRNVMFASIAGDPSPVEVELRAPPGGGTAIPALAHVCEATTGGFEPAVRIPQLVGTFARGTPLSGCTAVGPSLLTIARQIRTIAGDPCLPRDIAMPADCKVIDTRPGGETEIPACSTTVTSDCYTLPADPAVCPAGQHLRLDIVRSAAPSADTMTSVRCKL
jgi:hypothetical protein